MAKLLLGKLIAYLQFDSGSKTPTYYHADLVIKPQFGCHPPSRCMMMIIIILIICDTNDIVLDVMGFFLLFYSSRISQGVGIIKNIVSAISLTAITVNLLFWIWPLALVAIISLIVPVAAVKRACSYAIDKIYRTTVWLDTLWLKQVLGLRIVVHGQPPQNKDAQYVVISNHRSWFDIFLLQAVIVPTGPIVKFLIKRELIYVPIIGWISMALNFPRLSRGKHSTSKLADSRAVANATLEFDQTPIALVNFAEGTRFTEEKHQSQVSIYRHLLRPRSGGMSILLNNLPDIGIIDVTLIYPYEEMTFWQCLSGRLKSIDIHLNYYSARQITDIEAWLETLWREKDNRIKKNLEQRAKTWNLL